MGSLVFGLCQWVVVFSNLGGFIWRERDRAGEVEGEGEWEVEVEGEGEGAKEAYTQVRAKWFPKKYWDEIVCVFISVHICVCVCVNTGRDRIIDVICEGL